MLQTRSLTSCGGNVINVGAAPSQLGSCLVPTFLCSVCMISLWPRGFSHAHQLDCRQTLNLSPLANFLVSYHDMFFILLLFIFF